MRAFWAYIEVDQLLTTRDQVTEICEEIKGNVAHVIEVIPNAPLPEK